MWWCEWLGDVSLPANISLSLSINRPWSTAESTSLREKGSERNETQQGAGPVTAVSLSLDVTAATPGLWNPLAGLTERLSRDKALGTCRIRAAAHLALHPGNTRALLGTALWPYRAGKWALALVTAQKPKTCPGTLVMCNLRKLRPSRDCFVTKINNEIPYKCVYLRYSHS